jgi:hypothetical protein
VKVREKKEYGRNKKKSAIMYQLLKLKCWNNVNPVEGGEQE